MRIGFGTGTENVKEMMSKESLFFDVTITKDESKLMQLYIKHRHILTVNNFNIVVQHTMTSITAK